MIELLGSFPTWALFFDGLPKWVGLVVVGVVGGLWFLLWRRSRKGGVAGNFDQGGE